MSKDDLIPDLYQPGNILKRISNPDECQIFVMVCSAGHDISNDYFKAVAIHGCIEAGVIVSMILKGNDWELSSMLDIVMKYTTIECRYCDSLERDNHLEEPIPIIPSSWDGYLGELKFTNREHSKGLLNKRGKNDIIR